MFSPSLNVERGTLKLDGWWAVAYRLSARTILVRDEEVPAESTVLLELSAALTARGLGPLGADFPGVVLLTYTVLDLGYAPWVLWSTDRATGEADLNSKATEESFLEGGSATGPVVEPQNTDHARGARRVAGAPTRVVLTVGVGDEAATALEDALTARGLGPLGADFPGIVLFTYTVLDLGYAPWVLWSTDRVTGEAI